MESLRGQNTETRQVLQNCTFFKSDFNYLLHMTNAALESIKSDEQLDKEAFYTLLDKLLWTDSIKESESSSGRQFMRIPYHRQRLGLLGRPKPVMFKRADSLPGSLYRNFADQCYGILCSLGLSGLAQSLVNLI